MDAIWIEIPVTDLTRAKTFYETVFGHPATDVLSGDGSTRLGETEPSTGGPAWAATVIPGTPTVSLNQTEGFVPATAGSLPYFHVDGASTQVVGTVTQAGGRILLAPAPRGEHGVFTLIADSEGNALYLHTAS